MTRVRASSRRRGCWKYLRRGNGECVATHARVGFLQSFRRSQESLTDWHRCGAEKPSGAKTSKLLTRHTSVCPVLLEFEPAVLTRIKLWLTNILAWRFR